MFAGITSVEAVEKDEGEPGDEVCGMNSREGETVPFVTHVKVGPESVIY